MYTRETNSTIFITGGSFGANSSVGTVVAGSSVLDIGFTFCFASDGDPVGLNFFNVNGANFNGVSAVIGVSGDFEAIQNGTVNDTTSFADFFQGLAFYIVYDGEASGKYDVVNWLDIDLNDTAATHGQSFAFALDFKTGHLFLSKSGSVKVTDGSMDFDGEYFDVGGFLNADGDFDLSGSNLTYNTVPGFGAMGCN